MTTPGESKGRRALAALAEMARGSARPPTTAQLDSGLAALRARMDAEPAAPRRRRRASVDPALVAGRDAGGDGGARGPGRRPFRAPARARSRPPALTYRIEGGSLVDGGYLQESGRAGIKLFFAEGTEFILMPGTRSRLRAVDASGARIAIEHGTASFQVTPAPP